MESSLPTIQYNFRPIAEIESIEPNTLIGTCSYIFITLNDNQNATPFFSDVIGVCKSIGDLTSITTKSTNRKVSKRDLQLVDRTSRGVRSFKFPHCCYQGGQSVGGRSLNTVMSSMLALDPDIPEAHQLRGWFDNVGKNEESSSITQSQYT